MQGELEIRKRVNLIFLGGLMFSVIIYFADLSKFFPDHDVEFLFFAIGSTMVGFGLGATWILNKKVKIEFDRDKK